MLWGAVERLGERRGGKSKGNCAEVGKCAEVEVGPPHPLFQTLAGSAEVAPGSAVLAGS